ncbi:MAG: hypothetical protein KBA30_09740 [Clostridia bacterium]|nr:hypothetical protein [Clostridia bacterium]
MKKNMKKGVALLALLLMVGVAASVTPGLVSALEEDAAPPTVEAPATETEDRICPVTGEVCDGTGLGLTGEGSRRGWADGTPAGDVDGDGICDGTCAQDGEGSGLMTRQRLQDGSGAGGQQRARARDGSNGNCPVAPASEG